MTKLYGDGILVCGDAAGFSLNLGLTVRGMEFALASGVMAARTILEARKKQDFSKSTLSLYQKMLEESFVLKDFRTFKNAPHVLDNPRFFTFYPEFMGEMVKQLFTIGDGPKEKLSDTIKKNMTFGEAWRMAKDLRGVLKI